MKLLIRLGIAVVVLAAIGYFAADMVLSGQLAGVEAATKLGEKLPGFTMKDYTGKEHSLEDYKGKIVVLNFCSHKCPWSRGAEDSINALAKKYKDNEDVVFLGIDSHKATPPEELKEHYEANDTAYSILKDEGNEYADEVGAKVTPEIYVTNKDHELAYHGAPDNRSTPDGDATEQYLNDALAALVTGEEPETKRAKAWGCTIKRAS